MKNYGIFKKGKHLAVLAEPDVDGTLQLIAQGFRRLNGHISANDDATALKCAAGIPEDADNIIPVLMEAMKASQS